MPDKLQELNTRISAFLPPRYQHCYTDVNPISMGSASLKYDTNGQVNWDQIWTSFCDLAIAGGPPHRGKLLKPIKADKSQQNQQKYDTVVAELSRAISLVTNLTVTSKAYGWIGVTCNSPTMAAWLTCAIIAENIAAYRRGKDIYLPAGPDFRVEKEIKNVVTALAKTCHYWSSHGPTSQEQAVFATLLAPVTYCQEDLPEAEYQSLVARMVTSLQQASGWVCDGSRYVGWIGLECPTVETAIWLLRVLIVSGIQARREDSTLFLPTGNGTAQQATLVIETFQEALALYD